MCYVTKIDTLHGLALNFQSGSLAHQTASCSPDSVLEYFSPMQTVYGRQARVAVLNLSEPVFLMNKLIHAQCVRDLLFCTGNSLFISQCVCFCGGCRSGRWRWGVFFM